MDEIVVTKGKVIKVEEVPVRNGVPVHTETLIDFSEDGAFFLESTYSGAPSPIKRIVMRAELAYGKTYEVVLREVAPNIVKTGNGRKFQET